MVTKFVHASDAKRRAEDAAEGYHVLGNQAGNAGTLLYYADAPEYAPGLRAGALDDASVFDYGGELGLPFRGSVRAPNELYGGKRVRYDLAAGPTVRRVRLAAGAPYGGVFHVRVRVYDGDAPADPELAPGAPGYKAPLLDVNVPHNTDPVSVDATGVKRVPAEWAATNAASGPLNFTTGRATGLAGGGGHTGNTLLEFIAFEPAYADVTGLTATPTALGQRAPGEPVDVQVVLSSPDPANAGGLVFADATNCTAAVHGAPVVDAAAGTTTFTVRVTTGTSYAAFSVTVRSEAEPAHEVMLAGTVAATPPGVLTASSAAVVRSVAQGATSAAPRTVALTAENGAALGGLAISYPDGQPAWLASATLSQSTTPATLTVAYADPSALTPGVREARVRISTTTAGASPAFVDVVVRLEVTAAVAPVLALRDAQNNAVTALAFVLGEGPRTVSLRNAGTGTLAGVMVSVLGATDADAAPAWLAATLSGSAAPADLVLTPNWLTGGPGGGPLPPGTYAARVRLASTAAGVLNSPLDLPVTALAAPRTVTYSATVRDAAGRPLAGRTVRFAVPRRDRARPKGVARNTVDAVTDAQGVARAVFEAQRVAGAVRVTASCEGQTAEATLTVL